MLKLGITIGKPSRQRIISSVVYYVDSVAGNDANSGLSPAVPRKTLGALALQHRAKVLLKRGCVWRETFRTGAFKNVQLGDYGTGALPVLDCADVYTGVWTADPGRVNRYIATFTPQENPEGLLPSLWQNGVRLEYRSLAALANMCYYVEVVDGNLVYYLLSSSDPRTNGRTYEMSSRWFGVDVDNKAQISNVRTKRNLHNNGSTALANGSKAKKCIFEDGVKHNVYSGRDCLLDDCIMYKSDWPTRDNFSFHVGHSTDGSGANNSAINCIAVAELVKLNWAITNGKGLAGYMFHTSGAENQRWDKVSLTNCQVKNCTDAVTARDAQLLEMSGGWVDGCVIGPSTSFMPKFNLDNLLVTENDNIKMRRVVWPENSVETNISDLKVDVTGSSDGIIFDSSDAGKLTVNNTTILRRPGTGFSFHVRVQSANRQLAMSKNILYASSADNKMIYAPQMPTLDKNLFTGAANAEYELAGTNYLNWAAVSALPAFATSQQQSDIGVGADYMPSPVNALGAGATKPAVTRPFPTIAEIDLM